MNVIDKIRERLKKYPDARYQADEAHVSVSPRDGCGFEVSLVKSSAGFTVTFDGWHEHCTSEVEALSCFAFGLTSACRLRVEFRGNFPYRWTVEARDGSGWRTDSTVGLFFYPFWRRYREEYRGNSLIPEVKSFDEQYGRDGIDNAPGG